MIALELLAPAKDLICGIAAVDHGADAVYIGAQRFGARSAAGNSVEDIHCLCNYAHSFGVKVYVTVNTIIFDDELEATALLIRQLYEVGVDAILIQDMGILRMDIPPIPLHASTQTDNRSVEKVRWLQQLGFQRVVLARELSVDEISKIHREVPDMPLEVFVHGALCVSYSGLCYASHYCFGRSANRGSCAQFCRMKFDLLDTEGKVYEHQRHLLSLKDLNQSEHLEELIRAGATSFKIEGRLKDVAYVKNVVAAYSQHLDAFISHHADEYCRSSKGRCSYTFTPNLNKTFNRGFTTYFLNDRQQDIFSPDTPKAMGECVGFVKEIRRDSFNVAGTASFANGDGLCFVNQDRELEGFRVNRAQGNRLFPQKMPKHLSAGTVLYRNNDQDFERKLSHKSSDRKIPVVMTLESTIDGFALSVGKIRVAIECEHQQAEKPQRDNIIRQLSRLGDTPYVCVGVEMEDTFNYFIPSSKLVELRRLLMNACQYDRKHSPSRQEESPASSVTFYPQDSYEYNISNHLARSFYVEQGLSDPVPAFELQKPKSCVLLMQCRHCLRYAMGYCLKNGGRKPQWQEPLFLRLGDGRRFRLDFDCAKCQMNVYATD